MKFRDLAYETGSALDANRGRSLLTILGIVIGIGAVIAMTALIGGIKQSMVDQLGLNQARMVYMSVWTDRGVHRDDVNEVAKKLKRDYLYIAASTYGWSDAKSDKRSFHASIMGVDTSYFKVMGYAPYEGSFFGTSDDIAGSLVCVLDQGAVKIGGDQFFVFQIHVVFYSENLSLIKVSTVFQYSSGSFTEAVAWKAPSMACMALGAAQAL